MQGEHAAAIGRFEDPGKPRGGRGGIERNVDAIRPERAEHTNQNFKGFREEQSDAVAFHAAGIPQRASQTIRRLVPLAITHSPVFKADSGFLRMMFRRSRQSVLQPTTHAATSRAAIWNAVRMCSNSSSSAGISRINVSYPADR